MSRCPTGAEIVEALALQLAAVGQASESDRERARELLDAIGVTRVLDALAMAEGIIRVGEGFHSVERFFVDGSPEQRYLVEMLSERPPM